MSLSKINSRSIKIVLVGIFYSISLVTVFEFPGFSFSNPFKLLVILISLITVMTINDTIDFCRNSRFEIIQKVFLMAFAFYLTFALSGNHLFIFPIVSKPIYSYSIFTLILLMVLISEFALLNYIDRFANSSYFKNDLEAQLDNFKYVRKSFFLFFMINLIVGIVYLYSFNPAIMSYDSVDQYLQAIGIIPINNRHPAIYAILMQILLVIYESPLSIALAQIIYFSLVVSSAFQSIYNRVVFKKLLVFICFLFALIPTNGIYAITLWKDVPYSITLLWLTILLYKLISVPHKDKLDIWFYSQLVLALCLAFLFRHNGLIVYMLTSFALLLYCVKEKKICKKLLLALTATVFLIVLVKGPIYDMYKVDRTEYPNFKYYGLMHDMENVYFWGGNFSAETEKFLKRSIRLDEHLAGRINKVHPFTEGYYWTNILYYNEETLSDLTLSKFIRMYADTFVKNPQLTINSILCRNDMLWNIYEGRYGMIPNVTDYTRPYISTDYPSLQPVNINSRIPNVSYDVLKMSSTFTREHGLLRIVLWRFGVWTAILLLLGVYIGIKKRVDILLLYVPVASNVLSLVMGNGWQDYRYAWSLFLIAPFLIVWTMSEIRSTSSGKNF